MNKVTRGIIEKTIDKMLKDEMETGEIVSGARWVEKEIPISSMKNLVLGYLMGYLFASSGLFLLTAERRYRSEAELAMEAEEIRAMIRRRIPEILECIESQFGK